MRGDRREGIFVDNADRSRLLAVAVAAQGMARFDAQVLTDALRDSGLAGPRGVKAAPRHCGRRGPRQASSSAAQSVTATKRSDSVVFSNALPALASRNGMMLGSQLAMVLTS